MTRRTKVLTRLAAGAGVLALAATGLLAASGTAHAEVSDNVDDSMTGSLTVHKHVKDDSSPAGEPKGDPLAGVTFTVCELLYDDGTGPAPIDLTTDAGWDLIDDLNTNAGDPTAVAGVTVSTTCETPTAPGVTDAAGEVVFDDLSVGAYVVNETDPGDNLITEKAAPFVVTIPLPVEDGTFEYDVDAYPKNVLGEFQVTKTPGVPSSVPWVDGTTQPFTIATTLPATDAGYTSVVFSDSVGAGLEFVSWDSITLDGTALEDTDWQVNADGTASLTATGLEKLNASDSRELVATITTKVLAIAEGDNGVKHNDATVTVNGLPNDGDTDTYWGKLNLTKASDANVTDLGGAEFNLYNAGVDGQCNTSDDTLIGTKTTDAAGKASWQFFIGNDTVQTMDVCLEETIALPGHVLPADPWSGPHAVDANTASTFDYGPIVNHKPEGPTLPDTGAQGTWAMTVGGLLLITGAAVTLVIRRRKATH